MSFLAPERTIGFAHFRYAFLLRAGEIMKLVTISAVLVLGLVSFVPAQGQDSTKQPSTPKPYVNYGKFLNLNVETKDLQTEMPLAKFLQALEKLLPRKEKTKLRIDAEAFGDKAGEVAATPIRLPPFPKRMQLGTALRLAMSKIMINSDYRLGPSEFVITTPERALYTAVHEIRDILDKWQYLRWEIGRKKPAETDKANQVVQMLLEATDPESWRPGPAGRNSLQVLNGTRLVVRAGANRQAEVDSFLDGLRRLADLAVIMNAQVVEVDRLFYAQHIRPLLLVPGKRPRTVVPISDPLEALLKKQKLIVKGDEEKLPSGQESAFLSLHNAFTYAAKPGNAKKETDEIRRWMEQEGVFKPCREGFSLLADITVSPDRRRVRLKITQQNTQAEIRKSEALDLGTGKTVTVESPDVRETSLSGAIDIEDGQPLLMPLLYRPKEKNRIYLMLARPMIFIEEEQKEIEKSKLPPKKARPVDPAKEKPPQPERPEGPANIDAWKKHSAGGRKAFDLARYAHAEREWSEALKEAEKMPAKDIRLADTLFQLARVQFTLGRYGQADRLCLRAETLLEEFHRDRPLDLARCLNLHGQVYGALGFINEADKRARRALTIREKLLGKNHPDAAESIETLATIGQAYEAVKYGSSNYSLTERCLKVREKAEGTNHPSLIPCLLLLGRRGQENEIQRALAIAKKSYPANHPIVGDCLTALANYYREQKDFPSALKAQKQAMEIWKEALGPDHPRRGVGYRGLALIALAKKKDSNLEKFCRDAFRCQFSGLTDRELCHYFSGINGGNGGFTYWENLVDTLLTSQMALNHREAYLLEMNRRGGEDIKSFLEMHNDRLAENFQKAPEYRYGRPGNLEVLTVLRRLQGKPDPMQIVVSGPRECIFPNLPTFEVALTNLDFEKKPVVFTEGGNYRGGRQARWRFEVRDDKGNLMPVIVSGDEGGLSREAILEHEQTWNTNLVMGSFIDLEPGEYTVRILYHDHITIADADTTAGLILCRSEPIKLTVQPRVIDLSKKDREEIRGLIGKLDPKAKVLVLGGTYGKHVHDFIPPQSAAGEILERGWKTVPVLLDELEDAKLEPARRAWVLALLFTITGRNDPRSGEILGSYRDRQTWWQVWGGRDGRMDAGGSGGRDEIKVEGKIDLAKQRQFAESWRQFRNYLIIREKK